MARDHRAASVEPVTPRLSVLDQSPVAQGSTGAQALRNTLDLAELTDRLGYHRYWLAEHHGGPMLPGPSPGGPIRPDPRRPTPDPGGGGGGGPPPHHPVQGAPSLPGPRAPPPRPVAPAP